MNESYKGYEIEIEKDDFSSADQYFNCDPVIVWSGKDYKQFDNAKTLEFTPDLWRAIADDDESELLAHLDFNAELGELFGRPAILFCRRNNKHFCDQAARLKWLKSEALGFPVDDLCLIERHGCYSRESAYMAFRLSEFCTYTGCTPEQSKKQMSDLLGSYVEGECYGYDISAINESCWGFVGEYDYCLESAKEAIDSHIEHLRKKRLKQVKIWVKNRVPLESRV